MARIRTIKPEFWLDLKIATLSHAARLLALALLNHADDEGYFEAEPRLVRIAAFPLDEPAPDVTSLMQDLAGIGYIEVAMTPRGPIGRIVNFGRHQAIDRRRESSLRPVFDAPGSDGSTSPRRALDEPSSNVQRGLDGERKERKGKECTEPCGPEFLVSGGKVPSVRFSLSETQEFRRAFPGVHVEQEMLKAALWLKGNPSRRKTPGGMHRFMLSWLERAQNRSGGRTLSQAPTGRAMSPEENARVEAALKKARART